MKNNIQAALDSAYKARDQVDSMRRISSLLSQGNIGLLVSQKGKIISLSQIPPDLQKAFGKADNAMEAYDNSGELHVPIAMVNAHKIAALVAVLPTSEGARIYDAFAKGKNPVEYDSGPAAIVHRALAHAKYAHEHPAPRGAGQLTLTV